MKILRFEVRHDANALNYGKRHSIWFPPDGYAASQVLAADSLIHAALQDDVIGIDLEWQPDSEQRENDVALMQLASQSVVLLIRTCKIGVPRKLIDFLRHVVHTLLNIAVSRAPRLNGQSCKIACWIVIHAYNKSVPMHLQGSIELSFDMPWWLYWIFRLCFSHSYSSVYAWKVWKYFACWYSAHLPHAWLKDKLDLFNWSAPAGATKLWVWDLTGTPMMSASCRKPTNWDAQIFSVIL